MTILMGKGGVQQSDNIAFTGNLKVFVATDKKVQGDPKVKF